MTKHVLRALAVISTATLAAGLAAAPAGAADTTTTTTFTITGGGLSISAPETADLGKVAVGTPMISGELGPVTVTDNRGAAVAVWTANVDSTDFTTGSGSVNETVPKTNFLYTPGLPTAQNPVGAFTPGVATGFGTQAIPAFAAATAGNNSATWNPTVSITLPAQAVAGTYTGTITHSVS
jgi:hypothetical protein